MTTHDGKRDLQAAADELGVHYQTAYRWVRSGQLRATLVGGRYVVEPEDLASFDSTRRAPAAPAAPSAPRIERSAVRVHDALVAGDERTVGDLTRKLIAEGSPVIDVIQDVFVPALDRIGESWHDGELTVWVEHRASAITERILGEVAPNPRGRRRGTAMVAAIEGERHSLPTTMAAVALRDDNWRVHHLGADLPAPEIVGFCAEHDVTFAVLTVTNPDGADQAAAVADSLRLAGTPTLVGYPGGTLRDLIELARAPNDTAPHN
ncbi:MAG: helix-turn-helix domain-containing protein [Actinomycetia bacterium]|nr:helix-turn-helix domain-containing protein [Actinomycetes bacterium]